MEASHRPGSSGTGICRPFFGQDLLNRIGLTGAMPAGGKLLIDTLPETTGEKDAVFHAYSMERCRLRGGPRLEVKNFLGSQKNLLLFFGPFDKKAPLIQAMKRTFSERAKPE